ncbi:MAG: hypothetical protein HQL56_11465 [Magnetococcales bacterium]|nr:hypothetical protein [Magnetococcales bacterium]
MNPFERNRLWQLLSGHITWETLTTLPGWKASGCVAPLRIDRRQLTCGALGGQLVARLLGEPPPSLPEGAPLPSPDGDTFSLVLTEPGFTPGSSPANRGEENRSPFELATRDGDTFAVDRLTDT